MSEENKDIVRDYYARVIRPGTGCRGRVLADERMVEGVRSGCSATRGIPTCTSPRRPDRRGSPSLRSTLTPPNRYKGIPDRTTCRD